MIPESPAVLPKSAIDKKTVLSKLTGSKVPLAKLPTECRDLYSDGDAKNLGAIAREQQKYAKSIKASCQPSAEGKHKCIVRFANHQTPDQEFMSEFRFELDASKAVVTDSLVCILAG